MKADYHLHQVNQDLSFKVDLFASKVVEQHYSSSQHIKKLIQGYPVFCDGKNRSLVFNLQCSHSNSYWALESSSQYDLPQHRQGFELCLVLSAYLAVSTTIRIINKQIHLDRELSKRVSFQFLPSSFKACFLF